MHLKPPKSKTITLSKEQVLQIRKEYHTLKKSYSQIAEYHGISKGLVQRVIQGLGGYKDI